MIIENHDHTNTIADSQYREGFNLLFQEATDCIFILDETGKLIQANKLALERLEYTLEEMIDMNFELLHPLTRREEEPGLVKGMQPENRSKYQLSLCTKSGKIILLETRLFMGAFEGKNVFYGICKEVIEVKKVEENGKIKNIQALLDSLPFLSWMKDKCGNYVIVNKAFEDFYRIKNKEIIGKTDFDFFPQKIAIEHSKCEKEIIASKGRSLQNQVHLTVVADKWLETFVSASFEDNGEVTGTIGIARNITERKQLEIELANQKKFLKSILDTIPDYIYYKDLDGAYLGCNNAFSKKYLGINEDKVRGKTDFDLITDIELAKFYWQKDQEAFQNVNTLKYEGNYSLTDGRVIDIEIVKAPFWDEQGNVAGLIGIARDITERKRLEKQLREQAEYSELLFKTVPSAVLSVDKNRKIIRWNKIAEEITGYTAAEVIGKECSKVLHGSGECNLCGMVNGSPLMNEKCKIITKEGQIRHAFKSLAVLRDEFGEISERMACFDDITEMVNMEADLRESKERYAAIVNNAPQIVVIHKKGIVEFVNDAGIAVLGYQEDEFMDRKMKGLTTKDLFGSANSILIGQIKGEACLSCEIELIKKSGEIMNVLLKGTGITYEDERATLAVMMDITESKRLNAKLRASEEKFRQLAESINEVFLITDKERIVYASPAYERISGMSCQSLLDNQRSLVELIHSSDRERMKASFFHGSQTRNDATSEEFRIIRPDGEMRWLWLQSYPIRDEGYTIPLKVTTIVDISDRKKAEYKLREQEQQTQMEILLAARVQRDSLPLPFEGDKVCVSTIFKPHSTVSGDFFNYKWFEEQSKLCGYIIDVSGHGVATALQTATFKMMLDNVLLNGEEIKEDTFQIINQRIMQYLYEGSFVALLYFEFDFQAATLKLISAGITLFLAANSRWCSLVPISGCYLGIIDNPEIQMEIRPLKTGEIYCLMSDGASDLIELHGVRKQESLTDYEKWLDKLSKCPESNDDFSVICIEVLQRNEETIAIEVKNEGEFEGAQRLIGEFLELNAPSHAPLLEVVVNEAMNNGFDAGGRVRVKARVVGNKLIMRVKDEGQGFNTQVQNVQLNEDMFEKEFDQMLEADGGRGILLMKLLCDKVIYNAKGNEVLLMKNILH